MPSAKVHNSVKRNNPNVKMNFYIPLTISLLNAFTVISGGVIENNLFPNDVCGIQNAKDFTVGVNAGLKEYPWTAVVLLKSVNGTTSNECAGALINSRYILTSASCALAHHFKVYVMNEHFRYENVNFWNYYRSAVRLGEHNRCRKQDCVGEEGTDPVIEIGVEKVVPNPYYVGKKVIINDIALLRLEKEVTYTDFIKPICLPNHAAKLNSGDKVATTGWGLSLDTGKLVGLKKKVISTVVSNADCDLAYKAMQTHFTENHLCTKLVENSVEGTCAGDAGAPVMSLHNDRWYLQGVVSFGTKCGSSLPDVSTKVSNYMSWIVDSVFP